MWKIIIAIICVLLYGVSPYDILPDFILGWGWIDDAIILWILWRFLKRLSDRSVPSQDDSEYARNEGGQAHQEQSSSYAGSAQQAPDDDPYTVLGIEPGASQTEIKHAYRKLVVQYHPDKVMHLGEEFRKLAEKRFKEIQEAYQKLAPPP